MLRAIKASRRLPGLLNFRLEVSRRPISTSLAVRHERLYEVLPPLESFSRRHIGPSPEEVQEMLNACGEEVRFWCCTLLKGREGGRG